MSEAVSRLSVSVEGSDVVVSGDVDAHTCPDLAAALEPLPGSGDVRVDLAGVGFMDSSGLRVLIAAHQSATSADRRIVVYKVISATGANSYDTTLQFFHHFPRRTHIVLL